MKRAAHSGTHSVVLGCQSVLFEKPAADIRDVEGRRAVLKGHQPTQFVHVEVRVGFLTERKADEGSRGKSSDQDIAVRDHFFRAPSREHHGSRRVPADFPGGALDIFVRVKLEDKVPAAGDLDSSSDEGLAVLAPVCLPQRRRAGQHVVSVGKVVAAISPAVIEIGYSRNDDLLGVHAFSDEEVAISLACDAESPVCIAETGRRCTRPPERKESEALDEMKQNGFRVRNPLLNQYDPVVSNVLLKVHVRAGNHQVVGSLLPLVVDGEAMIMQISPAAFRQLVP